MSQSHSILYSTAYDLKRTSNLGLILMQGVHYDIRRLKDLMSDLITLETDAVKNEFNFLAQRVLHTLLSIPKAYGFLFQFDLMQVNFFEVKSSTQATYESLKRLDALLEMMLERLEAEIYTEEELYDPEVLSEIFGTVLIQYLTTASFFNLDLTTLVFAENYAKMLDVD